LHLAALASVCLHIGFFTLDRHFSGTPQGAWSAVLFGFLFSFKSKSDGGIKVCRRRSRRLHAIASIFALSNHGPSIPLAASESLADDPGMAGDDKEDFRVRPGRSRRRGQRADARSRSFINQVHAAVRKAGGNPNRIGRGSAAAGGRKGEGSGRFNARGRGAKVVSSFPKDGGGWHRDSAGRFRSRRVIVKARVVKLNPQRGSRGPKMRGTASKAADAHLRYLERDGVTRDGEKGRAYSAIENEVNGRKFIERGREDRHQFRFIVAPEDAGEMGDLRGFPRDLMRQMEKDWTPASIG
jgi:hypothetical protein